MTQGVVAADAEVRAQLWLSAAAGAGRALCGLSQVSRGRAW